MNDRTPPPEQHLSDAARASIRERLLVTAGEQPGTGRRWLLPIAAAVAVLAVSAGTGYVALRPSGGDSGAPAAPTTSAGATPTEATSEPPGPAETPSLPPSPPPAPSPSETPSQPPPAPTPADACAAAVDEQLDGSIEQLVSWPITDGTAGIWVAADQSVLCEDSGGIATAHRAAAIAPARVTRDQLIWSTSTYDASGPRYKTAFVAGGALPEMVTGIEYAWPDGHVQRARILDEGGRQWWLVSYVPTEGVLVERGTNFMDLDDVQVTVSYSGVQDSFDLPFATSMCAQVNHGC